jgi:threonyl-tRNA synthetase
VIEHFNGAFPLWLSPVQAVLIPIADRHLEYARKVETQLKEAGLRVEVDDSGDRMNAKIRDAQKMKIPYMLVVGDREAEESTVAPRMRSEERLPALPVPALIERMRKEVESGA